MTVKEYMENTFTGEIKSHNYPETEFILRPFVHCKDGYGLSIQGGTDAHCCKPQKYCNVYEELELGFPTEEDILINKYAENENNYTDTVYTFVPIEIVEKLIEKHGGIDEERTICLM